MFCWCERGINHVLLFIPSGDDTHSSPRNPQTGASRGTTVVPPGQIVVTLKDVIFWLPGFVSSISTIGTAIPFCLLLKTNTGTRLPWALMETSPDTPELKQRRLCYFTLLLTESLPLSLDLVTRLSFLAASKHIKLVSGHFVKTVIRRRKIPLNSTSLLVTFPMIDSPSEIFPP